MKPLNEYQTLETDAEERSGYTYKTLLKHARDLERRLALCRDALKEIQVYGKKHDGCCPYGCDTPSIAENALEATEPKQ